MLKIIGVVLLLCSTSSLSIAQDTVDATASSDCSTEIAAMERAAADTTQISAAIKLDTGNGTERRYSVAMAETIGVELENAASRTAIASRVLSNCLMMTSD